MSPLIKSEFSLSMRISTAKLIASRNGANNLDLSTKTKNASLH